MGIITLVAFPRFLGLVFIHDMLLNMLEVLQDKMTKVKLMKFFLEEKNPVTNMIYLHTSPQWGQRPPSFLPILGNSPSPSSGAVISTLTRFLYMPLLR